MSLRSLLDPSLAYSPPAGYSHETIEPRPMLGLFFPPPWLVVSLGGTTARTGARDELWWQHPWLLLPFDLLLFLGSFWQTRLVKIVLALPAGPGHGAGGFKALQTDGAFIRRFVPCRHRFRHRWCWWCWWCWHCWHRCCWWIPCGVAGRLRCGRCCGLGLHFATLPALGGVDLLGTLSLGSGHGSLWTNQKNPTIMGVLWIMLN